MYIYNEACKDTNRVAIGICMYIIMSRGDTQNRRCSAVWFFQSGKGALILKHCDQVDHGF